MTKTNRVIPSIIAALCVATAAEAQKSHIGIMAGPTAATMTAACAATAIAAWGALLAKLLAGGLECTRPEQRMRRREARARGEMLMRMLQW